MEKPCRKCGVKFPATEEYFYLAGNYLNFVCKPCMKQYTSQWRRDALGRPGARSLVCEQCGASFIATKRISKFCSAACKYAFKHDAEKAARVESKPDRRCVHCGADMPRTMRKDAKFCSSVCNEAAHNLTRKIVARTGTKKVRGGVLLSRRDVGDRDGWRCGLCGGRVDPKKTHPDPLCASVDHIVPLACGGTNDPSNLQLAHLRCNLSKRDRGGAQQLRMT